MKFTLENQSHYAIHGYEAGEIKITVAEEGNGSPDTIAIKRLTQSFILSADNLHENWQHADIKNCCADDFQLLLDYEPEVVILGTGESITFPPTSILQTFYQRNIGVEIMDTGAACRTFNVLAAEYRKVIVGFMQF